MRFGLQKLTLLDYPEHVACTVFTAKCNLRCPFCHNADLAVGGDEHLPETRESLLEFLKARKKILDGVCVTGGEPLLHNETLELLTDIKSLGLAVKLDTNGTFPGRLKCAVNEGLVDMVAMDIKNSPQKYTATCGNIDLLDKVKESVEFLLSGKVLHEFRTTVVGTLHSPDDFVDIGTWIAGNSRYFLQKFSNSGNVLDYKQGMEADDSLMASCLANAKLFLPNAAIRGSEI
ncbi:MAG: anaerobic ribonucleoside-triphosphate reductase activating protein [Lentisphaeria bacterium]|nr:anaerobic ribonucleoside-triphosphate reductase activating protein [Lentisphaeria bacterium]